MSKQMECQRFIYKIHSARLRNAKWNLTLPIAEARKNDEVISLASSQMLRWLDELNGIVDADRQAAEIKEAIRRKKHEPSSKQTRAEIRKLYSALDNLQFKLDYMCLIIDKEKDYKRACEGFMINGVRYKRLLGTVGGIKNSTIVFLAERHIDEIRKRIDCGRNLYKPIVPSKLEAYKALTCSASVPVSMPNGVLVVPDIHTKFFDDTIYLDDEQDGEPKMENRPHTEIDMDASDGFGLMCPALAERWSAELGLDYMMSGCNTRSCWEKGMVFTFDFHRFADEVAENYIVKDVWGDEVDIRDVELILTDSMLKLWDSYPSYEVFYEHFVENNYSFAVTKTCPKSLENVRSLNYQFIQSYDLSDEDIDELIQQTIDEIEGVLGGDWRKTILFLKGRGITEKSVLRSDDDFAKAIMIDHNMVHDPFIQSTVYQLIKNRINQAKFGVIKVHGNYSIVSGDPYALCQGMFGMEITGLLKAGEIYNKYWIDEGATELACFRAPMTCHNNVRIVRPNHGAAAEYWYQYMKTCTIFNSWDTTTAALNGCDFDGDLVMLTDNHVLVSKHQQTPTIMCVQRKAKKMVPTEADTIASNIASFGNAIGQITNRITSMFEVRSRYEKGSAEYDMLSYRIMCGQLIQQNEIDKAKGVVSKPMPKEWYDRHTVNKIEDDEKRKFYRDIVADKKPYFMRYIYPDLMKQYNSYMTNNNKKSQREFGMSVEELKAIPYGDLTDQQREFLRYHDIGMPVGVGPCVMNSICRKFEDKFDRYISKRKEDYEFDYTVMKSNVEYTASEYYSIKKLMEEYNHRLQSYSVYAYYNRADEEDVKEAMGCMNSFFVEDCYRVCSNSAELCDILLDLCYKKSGTKKFVWDMCEEQIISNLLEKNNGIISYPVLSNSGNIEYCGERFEVESLQIGENDVDCA